MKITKEHALRTIGSGLKNKTERYRIIDKVCDGAQWPDGAHYYVIDDLHNQDTHHVNVNLRPTWARYADLS